jgi:hypothetical protein
MRTSEFPGAEPDSAQAEAEAEAEAEAHADHAANDAPERRVVLCKEGLVDLEHDHERSRGERDARERVKLARGALAIVVRPEGDLPRALP